MKKTAFAAALAASALTSFSAQAITLTDSTSAIDLANALVGSGITISNAQLNYDTSKPAAFFTGGASTVGFDSGVLLTTGTTDCVVGPNNLHGCTGKGTSTSLKFDFVSSTGKVFFNYVFASEEYNQFVNSQYNDIFELRLNGMNVALLPGGGGPVSINNVNCLVNTGYYRNNTNDEGNQPAGCVNQNLDIQLDGLTTILKASADVLVGLNTFEFLIRDNGDDILDSVVFIQAGSFSAQNPVPAPLTLALSGLALLGMCALRKRQSA